jgi:hypothetical protein
VAATVPALGYAWHPSFGRALALRVATGCGIAYGLGLDQWSFAAVPGEPRGRAMTVLTAGLMTARGLGMTVSGAAAKCAAVHVVAAVAGGCGWSARGWWRWRRGGPSPGPARSSETGLTAI